eukprot:CAMPEP_0171061466 /NCGR_PEP_ID=MMETSP0766_2-20121228/4448_1 /TAXON_ID=439317 /ORGANISM="Gambierdiscus australes, Strain CAWD 149" /LENGTH=406 /DNA_ID=CAMNT_0011517151 /DNA_START=93 /DNA_END=1313 /DNA_ORIENTATION=-
MLLHQCNTSWLLLPRSGPLGPQLFSRINACCACRGMAPKNGALRCAALAGVGLVALRLSNSFVPAPVARPRVGAAAGVAGLLGASAPALADPIGDASKELTEAAYPFFKDVDWFNYLFYTKPGSASNLDWLKAIDKLIVMGKDMDGKLLQDAATAHHKAIGTIDAKGVPSASALTEVDAAIGRLIASVPESETMDVYNTFKAIVPETVPQYLMSTVKAEDAKKAYEGFLKFKDVVKANPITPATETVTSKLSPEKLDAISAASKKLSAASYGFLSQSNWLSDIYFKPLPGALPKDVLKAVDKAIVMGASMDPKLLADAAEAHHKAIGSIDAKGVTSAADYEAVNAAIGKIVASVPQGQVMDVFNAFGKIVSPVVQANMFNAVNGADAAASYAAFLQFKDVVAAAQR